MPPVATLSWLCRGQPVSEQVLAHMAATLATGGTGAEACAEMQADVLHG